VLNTAKLVVNLFLTVLIVGFLLLFAEQFLHLTGLSQYWPVMQLHRFSDPIIARLTVWLPVPAAKPYVPLALAAIFYLAILLADRLFAVAQRALNALSGPSRAKSQPALTGVESEKARSQLYKEYRKIEKALKEAKRKRCTFLSLDVVGSTSIKSGETDVAVTSTFRAYEEMLRRTLRASRAWKESWTPDGVMICFLNRADAVKAAQTVLERLIAFNEHDNALKAKFEIRCGVNEGEVVIFDDSAIEKLVEHTIDVAGHMQKHARPGSIWLSKQLHDALEDPSGFSPTGQEVDGYPTYEWSPKPTDPAATAQRLEPQEKR
jgi:class 3 adenylate cyclase